MTVMIFGALLQGCGSKQAHEAKYLDHGKDLFAQGSYDRAAIEFKNALRINPTDAEPRYYLGLVSEAQGDLNNAFVDFTIAMEQNPHFDPALLKVADYYFRAGEIDEASRRVTAVLADQPDNPGAHALRAAIYLRSGDAVDCEREALTALGRDSSNIAARAVLAGLYASRGNLGGAGEILDTGISLNPADTSLILLKAQLFEKYSTPEKVDEAYRTLLQRRPADPEYRDEAAKYYVGRNDLNTAEEILRAGVAAAPGDDTMKQLLANFLGSHRGLNAAEKEIQAFMAANPDNDDYYFWLADLYVDYHAADRAMALLNDLVQKRGVEQPGLEARTSLAQITFEHGNAALAGKLLAVVLNADPGNKDALFVRARIAYDRGQYEGAISDLRTILRSVPNSPGALQLLAEALVDENHVDLAIDTLSSLVDIDPTDVAARVRLAQLYQENGDPARGINALTTLLKVAPDYPIAWEALARMDLDVKDWAGADAATTKLDSFEGEQETAAYLRGESARRQGDNTRAITYFTGIIKAGPDSPLGERALASLVATYLADGQKDAAITAILGLNVDTAFGHTLLGELYQKSGRSDDAARELKRAISLKAENADPYLELAHQYDQSGQLQDAQTVLNLGIEVVPADRRLRLMLGDVQTRQGDISSAIANYQGLLDTDPGLDEAANNLAALIADYRYDDPAALDRARVAADRFQTSTNPLLLDTVGWIYYREGNLPEADTLLQRAVVSGPVPPEVHYHYGAVLLKLNQIDQARRELTLATQAGAVYTGSDIAKQLLTGLP